MKKIKRLTSGVLAALTISGMVSGCKNNNVNAEEAIGKEASAIEQPVLDYDSLKKEFVELFDWARGQSLISVNASEYIINQSTEEVISSLDYIRINEKVPVMPHQYEKLNRLLELYPILCGGSEIVYVPSSRSEAIDFDQMPARNSYLQFNIVNPNADLECVKKAIVNGWKVSLSILYFDENQVPDLLETLKLLSANYNGCEVYILPRENVSEEAFQKLMAGISPDWFFGRVTVNSNYDYRSYTDNVNAWSVSFGLGNQEEEDYPIAVADGVEYVSLYANTDNTQNIDIDLELSDSVTDVSVNFRAVDSLDIADIKNAQLHINTYSKEALSRAIKSGVLDYPDVTINMSTDYLLTKDGYDDKILVERKDEYMYTPVGEANIVRDEEGNVIDFDFDYEKLVRRK